MQHWRVALAQISPILGGVEANLIKHHRWIAQAREQGAHLVIFPELSLTGYYLRDLVPEVALTADSPELGELASESKKISVVAGFVEENPAHRFHIAAGYFEDGRLVHLHQKVYLPTYGMFDEDRYLDCGETIATFSSRFGPASLLICEDLWHPAAPLLASLGGAKYLFAISDSPGRGVLGEQLETQLVYEQMCATYARLFQCYLVFVNRAGVEEGVTFWGGSMVINPHGEVVARAPLFKEHLLVVEIDPAEIRRARVNAPLVASERPEMVWREMGRLLDGRA